MAAAWMLLKQYWYIVVIAGLLAVIGAREVRVAGLKTTIATERGARSDEDRQREKTAREQTEANRKTEAAHAKQQQEKEDAFTQERAKWDAARTADAAAARSLRERLVAATRGGASGATVTFASERDADRHEELGALAGEGVELLAEGRSLLQQRDREVVRLLDQIQIDRAACSAFQQPEKP